MALDCFRSYLTGRTQHVRLNETDKSDITPLTCGVPQEPVLAPVLFLVYNADLQQVSMSHSLLSHLYADDTNIYGYYRPVGRRGQVV